MGGRIREKGTSWGCGTTEGGRDFCEGDEDDVDHEDDGHDGEDCCDNDGCNDDDKDEH